MSFSIAVFVDCKMKGSEVRDDSKQQPYLWPHKQVAGKKAFFQLCLGTDKDSQRKVLQDKAITDPWLTDWKDYNLPSPE